MVPFQFRSIPVFIGLVTLLRTFLEPGFRRCLRAFALRLERYGAAIHHSGRRPYSTRVLLLRRVLLEPWVIGLGGTNSRFSIAPGGNVIERTKNDYSFLPSC